MGILKDLFTIGKGKASEAGQAIVDANLPTILDQQLRDANKEIESATTSLRSVMATAKEESTKLNALEDQQKEYSANIQSCLEKGREDLAREVAARLATVETQITSQKALVDNLNDQVTKLKANLHKAESNLTQIQSQASVAKAQLAVNKAREATTSSIGGTNSALASAAASLERINQKASHDAASMDAADELASERNGDDLTEKLRQAGVVSGGEASVDDILSRFKK